MTDFVMGASCVSVLWAVALGMVVLRARSAIREVDTMVHTAVIVDANEQALALLANPARLRAR